MPEMIPVDSSILEAVGYDPDEQELTVYFSSTPGFKYVYQEVPQSVFDDFTSAVSMGQFLARKIKGVYPSRKVER